jgi:hypothetical protein
MDYAKALEVLHALADGADPSTGERLEQNDIFNYPEVIRALSKAEEALKDVIKLEEKRARRKYYHKNSGKRWTDEEDEQLVKGFKDRIDTPELAEIHQRSNYAIRERLYKLMGDNLAGDLVRKVKKQRRFYNESL